MSIWQYRCERLTHPGWFQPFQCDHNRANAKKDFAYRVCVGCPGVLATTKHPPREVDEHPIRHISTIHKWSPHAMSDPIRERARGRRANPIVAEARYGQR
jgi:hypothetical protein